MPGTPHTADIRDLLTHAGFVRRLALRLLRDENAADDVVQETWLAALQRPPGTKWPLRAWLSGVVGNLVSSRRRRESRQALKERQASVREAVASTAEIVEQEATRRSVVATVLELEEPYRTALIMRFYHDMPPRRIARMLDVPVETVKTRIQRGLARLERRLVADCGGDRRAWLASLVPLAGLKTTSAAAAGSILKGAFLMNTTVKAGAAAAAAIGVAIALWFIASGVFFGPEEPDPTRTDTANTQNDTVNAASLSESDTEAGDNGQAGNEEKIPISPPGPLFAGRVTDAVTGEPVPGFEMYITSEDRKDKFRNRETVHDDDGMFRCRLPRSGVYQLTLRSSRYVERTFYDIRVPETGIENYSATMDPGNIVPGVVTDALTGKPIADAIVAPDMSFSGEDVLENIADGFDECAPYTRTDDEGRFLLSGLEQPYTFEIVALHRSYAQGWTRYMPGDPGPLKISLHRGFRVFGTARDDRGNPVSGIEISYKHADAAVEQVVKSGPEGHFRSDPIRPGRVSLHADQKWRPVGDPRTFTPEFRTVTIVDRDVEVSFGPSDDQVIWRGSVRDGQGRVFSKAYMVVRADRSWNWPDGIDLRVHHRSWRCDEDGAFQVAKLPPGRYKLSLRVTRNDDDVRYDNWWTVTFSEPGVMNRDIILPAGGVSGVVVDDATGRPVAGKDIRVHVKATDGEQRLSKRREASVTCAEHGRFRLTGLDDGEYVVQAEAPGDTEGRPETVAVAGGRLVDGLRLTVPRTGRLIAKLTGFTEPGGERIRYVAMRPGKDRNASGFTSTGISRSTGEKKIYKVLAAGPWIFYLVYPCDRGTGYVETPLDIAPWTDTEVVIPCERLVFAEGNVTASGRVTDGGGAPVSGVEVAFTPTYLMKNLFPGHSPPPDASAVTGADGRFQAPGLSPGLWKVAVSSPILGKLRLPDVAIEGRSPIVRLDLVIPGGTISAHLYRSDFGAPLDEGTAWTALLQTGDRWNTICREVRGKGSGLRVTAIPPGRYRLTFSVPGLESIISDPVDVGAGDPVDIGEIVLSPCGLLELEVTDSAGNPLEWLSVECNQPPFYATYSRGREDNDFCIIPVTERLYRITDLPTGTVELTIGGSYCLDSRISVELIPGRAVRETVALQPEP